MANPWFDFLQESLGKVGATMGRTPEVQGLGAAYGMTGLEYTILPYLIATGGDVKKAADLAKGHWVENVQLKPEYGSILAGAMTYPAGSGIAGVTAKAPVEAMARVAASKVGKGLETAGETIAPKVLQLAREEVGAIRLPRGQGPSARLQRKLAKNTEQPGLGGMGGPETAQARMLGKVDPAEEAVKRAAAAKKAEEKVAEKARAKPLPGQAEMQLPTETPPPVDIGKVAPLTPSVRTPGPSAALQKFFGEIDGEIKRARLKAGSLKAGFWRGKASAADVAAAEAKVAELQQLRKDTILMELPDDVAAKYEEAWRIRESIPVGLGPVETSRINQSDPAYQFRGVLDLLKKFPEGDITDPAFRQMVKNRYGQSLDEIAAHVSPGGYTESLGEEALISKLRSFSGKPTGAGKAYDAQLKQANAFIKEVESGKLSSGPTIPLEEDIRRRTEAAYERFRKGAEEDYRKAIEETRKKYPEQGGPLAPETAGAGGAGVPPKRPTTTAPLGETPPGPSGPQMGLSQMGEGPRGPIPGGAVVDPLAAGNTPPVPPTPPGGQQPYLGAGAPPQFPPVPQRRLLTPIPGEKVSTAALREYSGARETAAKTVDRWAQQGNRTLQQLGFRRTVNRVVQVGEPEMKDFTLALHGEAPPPTDPRMRALFDEVRAQYQRNEAVQVAFDPQFSGVVAANPDYAYRLWIPPQTGVGVGRGKIGAKPGFMKMRNDATFQEMLDAGFTPATWNPVEMAKLRTLDGIQYRENLTLVEHLKANGLAVPASEAPKGWRVPDVGPAFTGKGYKDGAGVWQRTGEWAVPASREAGGDIASRLEAMVGRKAKLPVGGVDVMQKAVKASEMLKRIKLVGSGFQHIDMGFRGAGALIAGGHPFQVLPFLGRLANVSVREAPRKALMDRILSGRALYPNSPLSLKLVAQKGWELGGDPTVMSRSIMDQGAKAISLPPPGTTQEALRVAGERLKDAAKFVESGLFEGVYLESQATALEKVIIPRIRLAHPTWTAEQVAGSAATEVNKMFSSLANWQSVAGSSPEALAWSRLLFFSSNEAESAIRQAIGTFAGPNKGLWRKYWVGLTLFMAGVANAINIYSTGKPLSADQYSPLKTGDQYSYMPGGLSYNTRFLSPMLPWKGQDGRDLYLDVVGQADTAYRLIADPLGFGTARLNVIPRGMLNQMQGENFMGKPLVTPQQRIVEGAADFLMPIGASSAVEAAKQAAGAKWDWVPSGGETRAGVSGNVIQSTGFNVRGATNREALDKIAGGVWDDLGPKAQAAIAKKDPRVKLIADSGKESFTGLIDLRPAYVSGDAIVAKLPESAKALIEQSGEKLQLDRKLTLKGGQRYYLNDARWQNYQALVVTELARRLASIKPLGPGASQSLKDQRVKTIKKAFTDAKDAAERSSSVTGEGALVGEARSVPGVIYAPRY